MSSRVRSRVAVFVTVLTMAVLLGGVIASQAMAIPSRYAIKKVINRVGKQEFHLSRADIKALITLCKRESDFNPRCRTGSYKGLFQLDNKSKHVWEPVWNTGVAIKEIKRRYKTPRRALAHSFAYGWY